MVVVDGIVVYALVFDVAVPERVSRDVPGLRACAPVLAVPMPDVPVPGATAPLGYAGRPVQGPCAGRAHARTVLASAGNKQHLAACKNRRHNDRMALVRNDVHEYSQRSPKIEPEQG